MEEDNTKEEQESCGEYGEIDIRACENGYVVEARKLKQLTDPDLSFTFVSTTTQKKENSGFEEFIFKNLPEVIEWIQENMAPTGNQRQFLDALGSDTPKAKNPVPYGGIPNIPPLQPHSPWISSPSTGTGNPPPQWTGSAPNTTVTCSNTMKQASPESELIKELDKDI